MTSFPSQPHAARRRETSPRRALLRAAAPAIAFAMLAVSAAAETVNISSAADWTAFANRVNAGETGLGAVMTSDVTLTWASPRAGETEAVAYAGDFDGAGHTLTIGWSFSGTQYGAPFAHVAGCFIHDLRVAGSLESDSQFAGGLVGYARLGNSRIERCCVSAVITLTKSGEASSGGFIGIMADSTNCKVTFRDCLFNGLLLGPTANCCGGFVGWKPHASYLYLYNCLFAPESVTLGSDNAFTFSRSSSSLYKIDSWDASFYTLRYGTAQCNDGSSMTARELAEQLGSNWEVVDGKPSIAGLTHPDSGAKPAVSGFVYQGVLRDSQGGALAQRSHTIEFRVYADATGGRSLWARSCQVLLDAAGLFNVALHDDSGDEIADEPGTGLAAVLADYAGSTLYVGLTVAGSGAEIAPRQKLLSAPFATFAADLVSAKGDFAAAGALAADAARISGVVDAASMRTTGDAAADGSVAVGGVVSGFGTLPVGGIAMWSGSAASIPEGWALCNGQTVNGQKTPDLRDRFLVGAGDEYATGAKGGEKSHVLTEAEMPSHRHTYSFKAADLDLTWDNDNYFYDVSGHYDNNNTKDTNYTGGGRAHENRPPYFALCYIMRVR